MSTALVYSGRDFVNTRIGYLVAGYGGGGGRQSSACVYAHPQLLGGEANNTKGTLFYHMEVTCNGIDCPPYDPQRELSRVV